MKYKGTISDPKDLVTKEYVDNAAPTPATTAQIDAKTASNPIAPSNLDYAVKSGITTNTNTLTTAEKTAAQSWLGSESWIFTTSSGETVTKSVVCH